MNKKAYTLNKFLTSFYKYAAPLTGVIVSGGTYDPNKSSKPITSASALNMGTGSTSKSGSALPTNFNIRNDLRAWNGNLTANKDIKDPTAAFKPSNHYFTNPAINKPPYSKPNYNGMMINPGTGTVFGRRN